MLEAEPPRKGSPRATTTRSAWPRTPHGRVGVCGCASLTFGTVTLHFESETAFEAMTEAVLDE